MAARKPKAAANDIDSSTIARTMNCTAWRLNDTRAERLAREARMSDARIPAACRPAAFGGSACPLEWLSGDLARGPFAIPFIATLHADERR